MEEIYQKKLERSKEEIKQLTAKILEMGEEYQGRMLSDKDQQTKQRSTLDEFNAMIKERDGQMIKLNTKIIKLERDIQGAKQIIHEKEEESQKKQNILTEFKSKNTELKKKVEDYEVVHAVLRDEK